MKKLFLTFVTVAICFTQPLLAGKSNEGGDKQRQKEVTNPQMAQPNPSEMQSGASMEAVAIEQPINTTTDAEVLSANSVTEEVAVVPTVKKQHKSFSLLNLIKAKKPHREGKKHEIGSTFGILSFVCGIIAFGFAWAIWPLGLTLAILAIVFGILGLSEGYTGRTLAIIGLVLGILTLILPVGMYWVVLAH